MTAFEITQLFLLVVNAGLIWKYVASTEQIKSAAISQAKSLSEQTQSAREQAKAAADQVEGASRPVLVLGFRENELAVFNWGNGPALNVKYWLWPVDSEKLPWPGAPHHRETFIEKNNHRGLPYPPSRLLSHASRVIARYESASGRHYRSEGFYRKDSTGEWYENRLKEEEPEFLASEMARGQPPGTKG